MAMKFGMNPAELEQVRPSILIPDYGKELMTLFVKKIRKQESLVLRMLGTTAAAWRLL